MLNSSFSSACILKWGCNDFEIVIRNNLKSYTNIITLQVYFVLIYLPLSTKERKKKMSK